MQLRGALNQRPAASTLVNLGCACLGYPHSQRLQTGTSIGDALLHWKHCTSVLLLFSSDVQALPPPHCQCLQTGTQSRHRQVPVQRSKGVEKGAYTCSPFVHK